MYKSMINSTLLLALALAAPVMAAQEVAPNVLLQATTLEVISEMQRGRELQGEDQGHRRPGRH